MKKIKKFLSSSTFHLAILYIVEIILTIMLGLYLSGNIFAHYKWFDYLINALKILTVLMFIYVLLYENLDYAYRVNWFILFLISPTFGGLIYLLCASKRPLPQKWRKQYRKTKIFKNNKLFFKSYSDNGDGDILKLDERTTKLATYVSKNVYTSVYRATSDLKFYPSGEQAWEDMIESLKNAKKYIYLEFYIIDCGVLWERVEKILLQKAKEGLEIRILFDDMGSLGKFKTSVIKKLNKNGIQTCRFNKVRMHLDYSLNFRNHRKYLIIDGNTVYTGGINLADEYVNINSPYGHWFDTGIRLTGDMAEDALRAFCLDWLFASKQELTIPTSVPKTVQTSEGFTQLYLASPFNNAHVTRSVFLTMLNNAQRKFYIATPYLALDKTTLEALIMAAQSGVDVRIAVPGIPDKKIVYIITQGYFNALIKSGVKIYTYTPGFLHAKLLYADDEIATVGSANMDYRSFYINFEGGVLLYKTECLKDINATFENLFDQCEEQHYKKQSLWFKIKHLFVRFLIPLC